MIALEKQEDRGHSGRISGSDHMTWALASVQAKRFPGPPCDAYRGTSRNQRPLCKDATDSSPAETGL